MRKPTLARPPAPGRETKQLGCYWRHSPWQVSSRGRQHKWRFLSSGHRLFLQHSSLLFTSPPYWPSSKGGQWTANPLLGTAASVHHLRRPPVLLAVSTSSSRFQHIRGGFSTTFQLVGRRGGQAITAISPQLYHRPLFSRLGGDSCCYQPPDSRWHRRSQSSSGSSTSRGGTPGGLCRCTQR